jgi:phage terminase large subunit
LRKQRFGCVVAHRRAGKTVASVMDLIDDALRCAKPDPRYAYVAPYYAQAKDVVWAYVKRYAGQIPGTEINESELRVDFAHNGARVRLYGADNYDRLRGIYLDGVVLDEYADQPPQAWREVLRPALADRLGWALFIGTPKGRNAFYDMHKEAEQSADWFSLVLRASETGIVPADELGAMRQQMSANEYAREMECDFDAAVEGAYYADALAQARREGRIGNVAADPLMQYRAFWDLGISDACTIWVAQFVGREVRVLDYYEADGQPLATHLAWLRARGYGEALCVLPHDGAQRDKVTGHRFEDHIRAAGFKVDTVPNQGRGADMQRIETARRLFPSIWFNAATTGPGIDALAAYHEKRDEKRGIGLGPKHNWASHGADAFGLMCVAYEEPRAKRAPAKHVYREGGWMR